MEFENSLKDKTIIITGANCGIGYEAALDFARRGIDLRQRNFFQNIINLFKFGNQFIKVLV